MPAKFDEPALDGCAGADFASDRFGKSEREAFYAATGLHEFRDRNFTDVESRHAEFLFQLSTGLIQEDDAVNIHGVARKVRRVVFGHRDSFLFWNPHFDQSI